MLSTIGALRTVCERREMINEKMKILQDLVPGCNKVIGKELIINYIQLLQHQVEKLLLVIGKLIEAVVAKGGDSVHYGRGFNLVKGGTTDYVSDGTKSKIKEDPLYSPIQEKFFLEEGIKTFSQANLSEFNCEELFQTELLPGEKRDDEPLDDRLPLFVGLGKT